MPLTADNTPAIVLNLLIGLGAGTACILIPAVLIGIFETGLRWSRRFGRWAFPLPTDTVELVATPGMSPELLDAIARLDDQTRQIKELLTIPV